MRQKLADSGNGDVKETKIWPILLADSGNSAKRNGNLDHFLVDNGNGDPPPSPPLFTKHVIYY